MGVADLREAIGDGEERVLPGVDVGDFGPRERRRNAGVRHWTDGVCAGDGAISRVLVVVEEDAGALFLPPLGRGDVGNAAFDLSGKGERATADFGEGPLRLDAD